MIMKVNIPSPQKKKKREFLSEDLFFSHFIHIDTYFFTIPVEFIYYKKYWITIIIIAYASHCAASYAL